MSTPSWAIGKRADEPNILGASLDRSGDATDANAATGPHTNELVARAQAGDKNAFGLLYKEHHAAIYRLARFHLPGAADDIVAETFLRAWKALPRYRDIGAPFVSWLYGIARHIVADEIRRVKRTEPRAEATEEGHEENHDDRLVLAAAIAKLPEDQRKVIEMKYLLGLRNPEVARLLDKTVGAVNAMQWRALHNLRDLMDGQR